MLQVADTRGAEKHKKREKNNERGDDPNQSIRIARKQAVTSNNLKPIERTPSLFLPGCHNFSRLLRVHSPSHQRLPLTSQGLQGTRRTPASCYSSRCSALSQAVSGGEQGGVDDEWFLVFRKASERTTGTSHHAETRLFATMIDYQAAHPCKANRDLQVVIANGESCRQNFSSLRISAR
jgi:hypothetical protein